MDFKQRYDKLWAEYADSYDLSSLNQANDKSNLEMIIRNAVLIEVLQEKVIELAEDDAAGNIMEIKKISDSARDLTDRNILLERQLGIDRKSRKKDSETTTGEYILMLKEAAQEFIEQRMVKVYCPDCKILVGRISPVHEHTSFYSSFQCSQCRKLAAAIRETRDVFFDLVKDDREWRRKYPVEIKRPRKLRSATAEDEPLAEAELILEEDDEDAD